MKSYLTMLAGLLETGHPTTDRTGTGTLSMFGYFFSHNMRDGFPILTTKHVSFYNIVNELLWMISGSTNVRPLQEKGVKIWNEWANGNGELGPVYGKQWRDWGGYDYESTRGEGLSRKAGIDQLAELVKLIKFNPDSRRQIVTAWNPAELYLMALPPCHMMFQTNVQGNVLNLQMYQRSADIFLGVPYNIASYALLLELLASVTGLIPGHLSICFGDLHLYNNHIEQAKLQLTREPYPLPQLCMYVRDNLEDYTYSDIWLEGYTHEPAIKAPIAI